MTTMTHPGEAQTAVRIPADVEREDRVLANLTARQLAILTVVGLVLYALFAATRAVLPLPVFAVLAVPIAVATAIAALGSRDGLSLDRLLVAAARQRLTPRVQVAAPAGVAPPPAWITTHATTTAGSGAAAGRVRPSSLNLPAEAVTDAAGTAGSVGAVDLGKDGVAAVCVCSTVNFALRTPREQEALVAAFGRYLHSLTAPVQVLIRAQRLDLTGQILELRERAGGLPHAALEQAARAHADYLTQLAAQSDLLRRQVLLVLREPLHAAGTQRDSAPGLLAVRRRRGAAAAGQAARHAAETRLARRIGEAVALLSGAGIVLTPLDAVQASAVLAGACNPDRLIPPTAGLAGPDEVITTAPEHVDADSADADRAQPDHWSTGAALDSGSEDDGDELAEELLGSGSPSMSGEQGWWAR